MMNKKVKYIYDYKKEFIDLILMQIFITHA